jgi:hypothetical protein
MLRNILYTVTGTILFMKLLEKRQSISVSGPIPIRQRAWSCQSYTGMESAGLYSTVLWIRNYFFCIRIRIPFSSEFWIRIWIRILLDLQKVPDPVLNIHSFTVLRIRDVLSRIRPLLHPGSGGKKAPDPTYFCIKAINKFCLLIPDPDPTIAPSRIPDPGGKSPVSGSATLLFHNANNF